MRAHTTTGVEMQSCVAVVEKLEWVIRGNMAGRKSVDHPMDLGYVNRICPTNKLRTRCFPLPGNWS